jgi:hypothetical protein
MATAIGLVAYDGHQPGALQAAQDTAEKALVDRQTISKVEAFDATAAASQLEQHAGLGQGVFRVEEVLFEQSQHLRPRAVEGPDALDGRHGRVSAK